MAAFDRICSGVPGMDAVLDNIRLGDNVVWQVTELAEFRYFAERFVRQAVADGRNVIYIRFGQHDPVIEDLTGVQVKQFNPDEGFETFTVRIRREITAQGRDAFYVFDCLSELQSVWYTDLMMGNFFRVTCPYLFELDTVAYFPILRGRHSYDAIGRIRDTTQLLLDVCGEGETLYVHPMKVWSRSSARMFLPQRCDKPTGRVTTVENGVDMSRFYALVQQVKERSEDQNLDSFDRFFHLARLQYQAHCFGRDTEEQIIASTMTRDERLRRLVRQYFEPRDYFLLRDRMIGSGAIGGKACGMLLARKIAEAEIPEYRTFSEPHDSFYIGSDVFYTYIVSNNGWTVRIAQRSPEGYFSRAEELQQMLLHGSFPDKIRQRFLEVLEYFGQSPFIVRSSSFLEDGFGNAFAGKYASVFCVNQGSPEERLQAFEQAVREVYASTMDPSALEYRRQKGLDTCDEQMAVLVQRVSGTYFGNYLMPCAAGVGYSHSAYRISPHMDPAAGMLRLVMGLGTKAVDRTQEDYPRLCSLDRPSAPLYSTTAQRHRYSQRNIDVLDCRTNVYREIPLEQLLPVLPMWYRRQVLEHDTEAETYFREMGQSRDILFASCQRLLENPAFTGLMQKLLQALERVYGNPVDIEYTVNMNERADFVINLLQCRPLYQGRQGHRVDFSALQPEKVFFELQGASMGASGMRKLDYIVQVDAIGYYRFPYARKYEVAAAVGRINQHFADSGKNLLLLTPGRIGTSSPELGVPVTFRDIYGFRDICEVAESRAGYHPELSYGSHMFQDLVEADICYHAIWGDRKTLQYDEGFLKTCENIFPQLCPEMTDLFDMIRVCPVTDTCIWMDTIDNHCLCGVLSGASDQ